MIDIFCIDFKVIEQSFNNQHSNRPQKGLYEGTLKSWLLRSSVQIKVS